MKLGGVMRADAAVGAIALSIVVRCAPVLKLVTGSRSDVLYSEDLSTLLAAAIVRFNCFGVGLAGTATFAFAAEVADE